jgi:hypothetical protein
MKMRICRFIVSGTNHVTIYDFDRLHINGTAVTLELNGIKHPMPDLGQLGDIKIEGGLDYTSRERFIRWARRVRSAIPYHWQRLCGFPNAWKSDPLSPRHK